MTMGLTSYAETAQCTQQAEVFVLNQKNCERLIEKRNPQALETMRDALHEKLKLRLSWVQDDELPLFTYFHYKLDERKRREKDRFREMRRIRNNIFNWKSGNLKKGPLIDQYGPGSIFYKIRMREKAKRGPQTLSSKGGPRGFGITRHLFLGKHHGAAYLSRKPIHENDTQYSSYTPELQTGTYRSYNSDSEGDENLSDYDMDFVDSQKLSSRGGKLTRSQILCDSSTASARSNVRAQKLRNEKTIDDFKNMELSEFNLTRLETKIEAWHTRVDKIDETSKASKKHLTKLHRYNAEVSSK